MKKLSIGIIIEFKKVSTLGNETIEATAQRALEQINAKQYAQELTSLGIKQIKKLGIAFQGKKLLVLEGN